jgi:hypothetical protein
MRRIHPIALVVTVLLAGAWLKADTLILRDGRRVLGSLVSIRSGVVEFEEGRGFRGNRLVRFDRDDVRRIELDESSSSSFSSSGSSERETDGANGRPNGLREREVIVSADVPWNDAGIEIRQGQSVYFVATGRVNWGPGRRDGAAGERNSPHNPTRPIPSRPGAALVGRIGDQDPFFIGDDRGPVRIRQSGRLYLGINDDYLEDNSGNFRVTVYH